MTVDAMSRGQIVRRGRLLDAVMQLVDEVGPENLQMRDVAERSGVALGTAYRYFSSKDHLLAAAMAEWHLRLTETVIAARQRVRHALDAVGPEFSGLLVDICCFLKGLADVERERSWPPRSAKVVLQLGLDRLARHYGLSAAAHGRGKAKVRTWLAADVEFVVGVGDEG